MGTTNTGLSKNYRIKANTIKTPIYPNESISSWLIRAALDCGTEPIIFTGFYWEQYRLWTYDLDRGFENIDPQIYDDIKLLSCGEELDLQTHSLHNYLYAINQDNTLIKGQAKWIIARSSRNRTHRIGQSYCPCCINEEPYLSNNWRLAWHFGCLKHRLLLVDTCNFCGTPYQPHLLNAEKRYLNHCHCCGHKLSELNQIMTNQQIATLQYLVQVFETQKGDCLGQIVDSSIWFDVLRYWINLLRRASIVKASSSIVKFLEKLGIEQSMIIKPKTGLALELLPLSERVNLLVHACYVMKQKKNIVIQAIQESGITQKALSFENYPSVLTDIIKSAQVGRSITRKRLKIENIQYSTNTLNRRWERIKRQLNLN